jgi:uncharacterized protein YciI
MKYAVLFEDNDEFAHMRPKFMADHLQFLADNSDRIEIAGPMKEAQSQQSAGGLWVVDAESPEQVQALVETDPFWPTGLRKSIRILEWTYVYAYGKKMI